MFYYQTFIIYFCILRNLIKAHQVELCLKLCPPCLQEDIDRCPPIPPNCMNIMKRPGCSCCKFCALNKGDRCGLSLPSCGPKLRCRGKNDTSTLHAIITNQATCQHAPASEDGSLNVLARSKRSANLQIKSRRIRSRRRLPRHPHHGLLKEITHKGPCSLHLEKLTTECRTLPFEVWMPSCKKGYYKPKQCMTSGRNGEPGRCWCVNKDGDVTKGIHTAANHLLCA